MKKDNSFFALLHRNVATNPRISSSLTSEFYLTSFPQRSFFTETVSWVKNVFIPFKLTFYVQVNSKNWILFFKLYYI